MAAGHQPQPMINHDYARPPDGSTDSMIMVLSWGLWLERATGIEPA